MIAVLILAAAIIFPLWLLSRSKYGHLHLSETPGAVLALLAGREYRHRLAAIMGHRKHQAAATAPKTKLPPPSQPAPPPPPPRTASYCHHCHKRRHQWD